MSWCRAFLPFFPLPSALSVVKNPSVESAHESAAKPVSLRSARSHPSPLLTHLIFFAFPLTSLTPLKSLTSPQHIAGGRGRPPLPRCAAIKPNGGRGRRGKFKHVESDAMEGLNRKGLRSVVALKKRRDSRVDVVLERKPLRPRPPRAQPFLHFML